MDLHWTYKSNESDFTNEEGNPNHTAESKASLEQGDILRSEDESIREILSKYHPYYASRQDNEFFIVLTQSCDLVLRNGGYKAPYISIAPVRPLRVVIEREFIKDIRNNKSGAQAYGPNSLRSRFEFFLERLYNNNYPGYFYLEKQPEKGLSEDMCAILALSISIKTEHYDTCLNARVLQLTDNFQAKLGWLVGQLYSRVGTPDWPEEQLRNKISEKLKNTAVWVNDDIISLLDTRVSEFEKTNQDARIDSVTLNGLIKELPIKKERAIEAILNVLISEQLLPPGNDKKKLNLQKKLRSDPVFSSFFKSK
jgi:hypothetical protein